MFENLLKQLQELQNQKINVPIDLDDEGYLDRECPKETCLYQFKVLGEDWSKLSDDASVYCPSCRHEAGVNSWFTKEQLEHGRNETINYAKSKLGLPIAKDVKQFNAKQSNNSFLKVTAEYKGSTKEHDIVPVPSRTNVDRKIECVECRTHYSITGDAKFCPCCGHKSEN
ncbi:MAG: hypothetical protein BGO31_03390 [Bacteroidetes bacterium 43-16]|nr:MAG: hypothetical protein BGO31_03390 [Bacteroidetes bacterium 43-16]